MMLYAGGSVLFLLSTWFLIRRQRRKPTLADQITKDRDNYERDKHFLLKQIDKAKTAQQYQLVLDQAYTHGLNNNKAAKDYKQAYIELDRLTQLCGSYRATISELKRKLTEQLAEIDQLRDVRDDLRQRNVDYSNALATIATLNSEIEAIKWGDWSYVSWSDSKVSLGPAQQCTNNHIVDGKATVTKPNDGGVIYDYGNSKNGYTFPDWPRGSFAQGYVNTIYSEEWQRVDGGWSRNGVTSVAEAGFEKKLTWSIMGQPRTQRTRAEGDRESSTHHDKGKLDDPDKDLRFRWKWAYSRNARVFKGLIGIADGSFTSASDWVLLSPSCWYSKEFEVTYDSQAIVEWDLTEVTVSTMHLGLKDGTDFLGEVTRIDGGWKTTGGTRIMDTNLKSARPAIALLRQARLNQSEAQHGKWNEEFTSYIDRHTA